jgi:flagellum-specific peptidoglycan hydrolase FlgJ
MTPDTFIQKYSPYAFYSQRETEVPAIAQLAQGAFESGWGKRAIGFNLFGIKYRKGDFGCREVLTTEYADSPNLFKGSNIKSITWDAKTKQYIYKLYQYFADYPSPREAFLAHARLLLTPRYKHCLRWKDNPKRYLIGIWQAGYATDPVYGNKIKNMVDSIERRLPEGIGLEKELIREAITYMQLIQSIEPVLYKVPEKLELEQKLLNRLQ